MSWQLGAFGLLGLGLAGGFAWYERVRPDARIVALVATLAAFGALGRIAFAAVPNVKPTTDIVLISGYALGGAPGFAVGALAGLASNFFFGQGPWTPWQMAAWGATGMIGAGLAWLGSRRRPVRRRRDAGVEAGTDPEMGAEPVRPPRIGRLTLAVVCGVVGFAFTAVQDVGDWVTYSDHSLAQLRAYVGQGIGFDIVHAAGCVVFALLLGPALIGAIQRFTRRLQVRWVAPGAAFPLLGVGLASLAIGLPALGSARAAAAPGSPVGYLLGAQNADGGFGSAPGQPSSQLFSGWAALGLASANVDPLRANRGGHSLIGYIEAHGLASLDTGSLERTILVVRAAGLSARSIGGEDLLGLLERRRRANGSFGGTVNLTAFGLLALRSAGAAVPAASTAWLVRQQDGDGGYGFAGAGSTSDSDDTGAVLEALAGQPGAAAAARARAVGYLRGHQDGDGGFASQPGMGSNAQSTAWAVQGLVAAGVNPAGLHRHRAPSPLGYLRSLIGTNGSVAYARGESETPVWVTGEALMALQERALPLAPMALPAPHRTPHAARPGRPHRAGRPRSTGAIHSATHSRLRSAHRIRGRTLPDAMAGRTLERRLLRLAAGAGVAAAVLLAPVGVG
jgi:energy-coupling factor transport system substrate-specific component